MIFDFKNTAIFQTVRFGRYFEGIKIFKRILAVVFITCLGAFLYGFLLETFTKDLQAFLLGLSLVLLILLIILKTAQIFFNSKLKKPKLKYSLKEAISRPEEFNLAPFLSYEAAKAISKTIKFSRKRKLEKISSEALLYFLLKDKKNFRINFIFSRSGLNQKEIKQELKEYLDNLKGGQIPKGLNVRFSEDFLRVISEAAKKAKEENKDIIETEDILISQTQIDPILKKHLIEARIKTQDIENLAWWIRNVEEKIKEDKKFWEYKNLVKKGSLAKEWTAGYTITLDKFSTDLTEIIKKNGFWDIIGHKAEIQQTERILSRSEINNALLVGQPGTGRRSIIQAIAQKSILGQSSAEINHKRLVELNISSILSQAKSSEEITAILDAIFQEVVSAGNVILIIDEFHNFVGQEISQIGLMDISGILGQYLQSPKFQAIALTNPAGLHKNIEKNPSILNLFEKVEVSEISERETILLLGRLSFTLEKKYKKFITYPAIRDIVEYSARYLPNLAFPKKAIDLLDEIMVYVATSTKDSLVLPKHVAVIISAKTEIPIGEIRAREKVILLNLENLIHKRIINQDKAVREISSALRRARADISVRKKPMGGFLFLGPTGVGKTETAKALAEIYFGSESRMIRLDMSEFQDIKDIPRLIGSSEQEGLLTTKVREDPFSLILLDEIEKAHPNILNLFLQILDEGNITDGLGRKVDFKNSIIVATSNAGYKIILKALREKTARPPASSLADEVGQEWLQVKEKLLDELFKQGTFRPEFINRFDAVIVYKPLSRQNLLDIAGLLFQKLKKNLNKKDIELVVTEALKEKIVELSYNPMFGARQMKRVIQDKIENRLARAILSDRLERGDRVEVNSETFELKINS